MKILFLDIDGVLNGHQARAHGYCGIEPENSKHLNAILSACPEVRLVISSAWRYMIHPDRMTLLGFETLLICCGIWCHGRVAGHTVRDEVIPTREEQILAYVDLLPEGSVWAVLDDLLLDLPLLIQTEKCVGLTAEIAQRVIEIFREEVG